MVKIGKIIIRIRRIKLGNQNKKKKNNNNDLCSSLSMDKINDLREIGTNAVNDNIEETEINNDIKNEQKEIYYFSMNNKNNRTIEINNIDNYEKNNDEESSDKNSDSTQKVCRICYQEEDDENNPLIQPCLCSGSMKFIHLKCLKQWIYTRSCILIENNEYCNIFLLKEVDCELCKNKLPDYVRHKNK